MQFWNGEANHCDLPGCEAATVTVASQTGDPPPDLTMYVFDSGSYTGYHGTPEINGEVGFTLLRNPYFATRKR